MSSTEESTTPAQPTADTNAQSEMSDIDRIKAAHAARRARRSRPPKPPSSSVIPPSAGEGEGEGEGEENQNGDQKQKENGENNETSSTTTTTTTEETKENKELKQEISSLKLELSSLRRNHLENIKRITEQRDMFAEQLAKEQEKSTSKSKSSSSTSNNNNNANDLEAQLRAARTRNSDLESENTILRDENKQLSFRVQASKTLDAASNGYQSVVEELVDSKLKCAQLSEEKEDLIRINKELTTTSAVLRNANGELEKSRSQWVLQCAEVEKKRTELENMIKDKKKPSSKKSDNTSNASFNNSDLQELKL